MSPEPDESAEKLLQELPRLRLDNPDGLQTRLSAWIAANRPLLITGGAVATGGAQAVAWIVEHVDHIQAFVKVAASAFHSKVAARTLDFDSLTIGGVPLADALGGEPAILAAVVKGVAASHGFDDVASASRTRQLHDLMS